jgi:hypothetical protein
VLFWQEIATQKHYTYYRLACPKSQEPFRKMSQQRGKSHGRIFFEKQK